jgi:acetoacetyl-CoA synthetase
MGSSELYHIIEQHFSQDVEDCLAVGQRQADGSERVVMFLKPTPGNTFTLSLEARVRKVIAAALTRRHVPEIITACPGVPVTMSGKKIEASVKKIL